MNKTIFTILLCALSFLEGYAKKVYDLKWNIKEHEEVLYDLTLKTSSFKSNIDSTKSDSKADSSSLISKEIQAILTELAKSINSDLENSKQKVSFASSTPGIIDVKVLKYKETTNSNCLQSLLDILKLTKPDSVSAEDEALMKYIETRDESLLKDVSEGGKLKVKSLIQTFDEEEKSKENQKPMVTFRGSVYENGAIHSFWTKQNQKNLLAVLAQLPTEKVGVGDSWSIDVNLISCNENVIWKDASKKNRVTLENIIVENGETIAVLNYDIVETFRGEYDFDNVGNQAGFNPFMGKDKVLDLEIYMIGKGYFSITKGKWKEYSINIINKNTATTSVQTYSFQEK